MVDYNFNWRVLMERQQRQVLKAWSKTANRRIRSLRDRGIDIDESEIGKYLKDLKRRTLPGASKKMSYGEVLEALEQTQRFLLSETSTISGIRRVAERILQRGSALEQINEMLERNKVDSKFDYTKFYAFLHSSAYKNAVQYFDSEEIIADYLAEWQELDLDTILITFEEYLTETEVGYDELQEKMKQMKYGKIT